MEGKIDSFVNKDLTFQLYTFIVSLEDDNVYDNSNIKTLRKIVVFHYSD
jgi:hypothetical protein